MLIVVLAFAHAMYEKFSISFYGNFILSLTMFNLFSLLYLGSYFSEILRISISKIPHIVEMLLIF
jgi:hypothetical protein